MVTQPGQSHISTSAYFTSLCHRTQVTTLASRLRTQKPKGVDPTTALLDTAWAAASQLGGLYGYSLSGLPAAGGGELLLALLNALRNASFVPSNERTIGHSARAVQVAVGECVLPCVVVHVRRVQNVIRTHVGTFFDRPVLLLR